MRYIKYPLTILLLLFSVCIAAAQEYRLEPNLSYKESPADSYARERGVLDLCFPEGVEGFKTIVWFHGGGLTGGEKYIPGLLRVRGFAIAAPNYRLSPKAEHPAYIEDAAEAVAWVIRHIEEYGGDPTQVYVGGHSAGGYLSLMLALDKSYLGRYGIDPDDLPGFFPVSGQTVTHYTIRSEMGLPENIPHIGPFAPLAHIREKTAPILLVTGESSMELAARAEENQYLYETLRALGNRNVELHVLSGFDHNTVMWPAQQLILRFLGIGYDPGRY